MKTRLTLPLGVVVAALGFYGLTLNWGVTLQSLPFTSSVAGWDWRPMLGRPLAFLLTLPLRVLPGGWIPVALNLVSATLAAATLGLLARSIQLLPWDCPPNPKKLWALRLPVLLGCGVCGLEFNFWQDATAMTAEMLDVFLLAASIGCALEFYDQKNPRWLDAAAVIWGIGVAENWAMLLLSPVFFIFLALPLPRWKKIKRNWWKILFPLLKRQALAALAAVLVFAFEPLLSSWMPHSPISLGEAWQGAWQNEHFTLRWLRREFWVSHRLLTLIIVLYFFLPILACSIRLKNEARTNISFADKTQMQVFRFLRVAMLLACLWLVFDPEVGPRKLIQKNFGMTLPLLTFDYLLALSVGFLTGSLLYGAQIRPRGRAKTEVQILTAFFRRHAFRLLAALAVLATAALAVRNFSGMWFARSASLKTCGELLTKTLPAEGGIVLANNVESTMVLKATLAQQGKLPRWQVVNFRQLMAPKYRAWQEQSIPSGWTNATDRFELLTKMSRAHRIFFLQPAPGILLDTYYAQPAGGLDELKLLPADDFAIAALEPPTIAENEKFWDDAWDKVLERVGHAESSAAKWFPHLLSLSAVKPDAAVRQWFAISLNNWGVQLQRNGKLKEAKQRFEQARWLDPENLAAQVNFAVNTNLLAGEPLDFSPPPALAENFSERREFETIVENAGAMDQPAVEMRLGNELLISGFPRQALQQYDRARQLVREAIAPELMMAGIFANYAYPAKVFPLVHHLRGFETNTAEGRSLAIKLSALEARAWLQATNEPEAQHVLETLLQKYPDDPMAEDTAFQIYLSFAPTNALAMENQMLAKNPENFNALNNKAALLIQLQRAAEALPLLDRLLTITNLPTIKLNRAVALLQTKDFAAAETVYHELEPVKFMAYNVNRGLAEIAENRHDTNAAANYYHACLTHTKAGTPDWLEAKARLAALEAPRQTP